MLVLFLALGRERARAMVPDPEILLALADAGASGWRARHVLGRDPVLNAALIRHWAERGVVLGSAEDVCVAADLPRPEGLERLVARGWRIQGLAGAAPARPRLELHAPDGSLAWSGVYAASDILLAGAMIWDRQAMLRITTGEKLPPFVPAGCAPPVPTS